MTRRGTRFEAAERRRAKAEQLWGQARERDKTRKHARCGVCGKRFVCDNYEDGVARVFKYKGVILCAWCHARPEIYKKFVKMQRVMVDLAAVKSREGTPTELLSQAVKKARKILGQER